MRKAEASSPLATALASAIGGKPAELFRLLENGSGLPGPRMNVTLATAFADACLAAAPRADALAFELASLPADEARGASPKEFLTVAGILAVAARAARDEALRGKVLALLEEKADDPRFRVRDAVPMALAMLGPSMKDGLAEHVAPWTDRYFHAAAVLRALGEKSWLETFPSTEPAAPLDLFDAAFRLAHDAPRSAFRYPGHKALLDALAVAAPRLLRRFPAAAFERLRAWGAAATVPELRELVRGVVIDPKTGRAPSDDAKRVLESLDGSAKPPRDPTKIIQGMRGRAKKRSAR